MCKSGLSSIWKSRRILLRNFPKKYERFWINKSSFARLSTRTWAISKTENTGRLMTNRKVQFQIEGLLKLEKVSDYLNLVDKKIKLVFKNKDSVLNTKCFSHADVADLSDTGTHLILRNVHIRRYIFFSKKIERCVVPIGNISTIQILAK